jgi:hypothetical protein
MPGGLLQLNAYGAQNQYLNGNPQMTFFKVVYRRYTNFSSEYIRQNVKGPNQLSPNVPIQLTCKIDRNGDLIQQIYFVFNLPDIYSAYDWETAQELIRERKNPIESLYNFNWIKNIGTSIINWITISIGGQEIDKQYGEWMNVWSELNLQDSELDAYNEMIGNIPELFSPDVVPGNNGFYPVSSLNPNLNVDYQENIFFENKDNARFNPYFRPASIKGRKIFVPINFWFCRNPGLSLPLIALQYHDVFIRIELRPLNELYTILETDITSPLLGSRIRPNQLKSNQSIGNFLSNKNQWNYQELVQAQSNNTKNSEANPFWNLDPHFLVNYYFLDTKERERFASVTHEYLITQTNTSSFLGTIGTKSLILNLHHPSKQLIWTTKRSDVSNINDWNNYTNWLTEISPYTFSYANKDFPADANLIDIIPNKTNTELFSKQIMKSARILFNGEERFASQNFEYFSFLQPYEYNIRSPKDGIYVFSFSIEKEKFQPSGACNMARINKIQLEIECNKIPSRVSPNETLQYAYGYDINVYSINYNVLRIMGGMAGLVFTN